MCVHMCAYTYMQRYRSCFFSIPCVFYNKDIKIIGKCLYSEKEGKKLKLFTNKKNAIALKTSLDFETK